MFGGHSIVCVIGVPDSLELRKALEDAGLLSSGGSCLHPRMVSLNGLADLAGKAYTRAVCALPVHFLCRRYVMQAVTGNQTIGRGKVGWEVTLDDKFLGSTSDVHLSTGDIAPVHKHVHEIERLSRDLTHAVAIETVHARRASQR